MKIICMGDSNTWGFDPRGFGGGRYEKPWPQILQEITGSEVVNLGLNGREFPNSEERMQWLTEQIEAELPADLLIILLGTNDLLNINGAWSGGDNRRSICRAILGEIRRRMETWFTLLRERMPGQRILLLAPPTCEELDLWDPGLLDSSLPMYREMAERFHMEEAECTSWDLELAYDGVHLTEAGHRSLAEKVSCITSGK